MLNTEAMSKVRIAFGTIVGEIKDVSCSYKEAKMALDVGKIFYSSKNVVAYSNLGIGRLIYQLPLPLCRMFIKEIFDGKNPDEFDEETLTTINKFFENSLNVSETSRQLYIHRNTLVYRLDKLQKSTGLDLRVFEDAITFEGDDGNEETEPLTPQLRALDAVNPMDRCFTEALEGGITTVVTGPGSANPVAGQMLAMKTYGRRIDDMVLKEPMAIKFALGENPKSVYHSKNQSPTTRMATAAVIREQLSKAKRYLEDQIKADQSPEGDYDPPEYDAGCEALAPLLERKIQAHFHAHRADDICLLYTSDAADE